MANMKSNSMIHDCPVDVDRVPADEDTSVLVMVAVAPLHDNVFIRIAFKPSEKP